MAIAQIVGLVVGLVIGVPISALLLMLASKIFKLGDTSYVTALKAAGAAGVIAAVLSLIGMVLPATLALLWMGVQFLVGIAVSIYAVKMFYDEGWKETLLTWLVWMVFTFILYFVIMLIFGALIMALFMGSMSV